MFRSSLIYSLAALSSQASGLILLPLFSRVLSVSDFASLSLLESCLALISVLGSLALDRAAQRFYFESSTDKNEVFGVAILGIVSASVLISLVIAALVLFSKSEKINIYYFYVSLCSFGLSLSGLSLVYAQVTEQPSFHLISNLVKGVTFLIFSFLFIGLIHLSLSGYVIALSCTYFTLSCLAIFYLPRPKLTTRSYKLLIKMLRYSLPFLPSAFAAWGITMGGRFILEVNSSIYEVGLYSFWFKVSLVYFVATGSINMALAPFVYRWHDKLEKRQVLIRLFDGIFQIYFLGAIALLLVSLEVGSFLGGNNYTHSYFLFSFIICTHFISSSIGAVSDLKFYSLKLTSQHMLIFLSGCVVSLVIGVLSSPVYGAEGVAIGALSGMLFISLAHTLYLRSKGHSFNSLTLFMFSITLMFCAAACEAIEPSLFFAVFRWILAVLIFLFALYRFSIISKIHHISLNTHQSS